MKRIIAIVLVVLVVVTGALVSINSKKQAAEDAEMEHISSLLTQYFAERSLIERDIENAWKEYDELLSGGDCCFVLFIEDISKNLMEVAYPAIEGYKYSATVVMNDLQIPSDEGCITKSDYNTLISSGWDFAIGTGELDLSGDDSVEVLDEYIRAYKEKMQKAGLELPETLCFGKGQYDEKYTQVLLDGGFKVIRHYEEIKDKFSHGIERNGLYLISTGTVCSNSTTTLKKDMTTAYNNEYTYGITVRYITQSGKEENNSLDCNVTKYKSMLDFIEGSCSEARVFSANELYNYKSGAVIEHEGYVEQFNQKIDEMEKQLEEINLNIDNLKDTLRK